MKRRLIRIGRGIGFVSLASFASYNLLLSGQQRQDVYGFYRSITNSSRAGYILYQTVTDYQQSLKDLEYNTEPYHKTRSEVHTRTANRILQLSKTNKGIYLKLGQYLGNLQKVVPWEFTQVLKVLQDSAPALSYDQVKIVIQTDLHKDPTQIFSQFDKQAIAAASLAQVHRAVLKDSQKEVAIKIQYPFLKTQSHFDLIVLKKITLFCNYLIKRKKSSQIDLIKLFQTWTNTLVEQLDFNIQFSHAMKCKQMFKGSKNVYIPEYYKNLSTDRMIVMEFIHGVKINEKQKIQALGVDPHKVAVNLVDIFARMIFQFGFIHCDAHPGNILVRRQPNSIGHDIVLLDHGLYRSVSKETIKNFSGLWLNLMQFNKPKIDYYAKQLNIQKHIEYLPIIFLLRTRNTKKKLGDPFTLEERKEFRSKDLANFDSINDILQDLPPDLMFIIRASNLIAIHNLTLGGTTRERLFEYAKFALRSLHEGKISYAWNYVILRIKIWIFEHLFFIYRLFFPTLDEPTIKN